MVEGIRHLNGVIDGPMSDLYGADIVAWAEQQADALRRRAANEIDWENVAEEIESWPGATGAKSAIASRSSANIF